MRAMEFMGLAAVLHAIQHAIRGAQKLFRRVAIFRKRGDAGADGKARLFRFRGEPFPNARGTRAKQYLSELPAEPERIRLRHSAPRYR